MNSLNHKSFSWRMVFSLVGNKWGIPVFILLTMVLIAAINPLVPVITLEFVDHGFSGTSKYGYTTLIMALVGVTLLSEILIFIQTYLIMYFSTSLIKNIRIRLYQGLQKQSLTFFTNTKSGEIITRITSEANSIGETVLKPVIYTFQALLTVVSSVFVMFILNWKLTLVILSLIPLSFLLTPIIGRLTYKVSKRLLIKNSELNSHVHENLSVNGVLLNRWFGRNARVYENFAKLAEDIRSLSLKQTILGGIFTVCFGLGATIAPILVFWLGRPEGPMAITAGVAVAFVSYISSLFTPVEQISQLSVMLQGAKAVFERLFEYLDMTDHRDDLEQSGKLITSKDIKIEKMSFKYEDSDYCLKDINLDLSEKKRVAIIGPSGSGKSTLTYILSGLLEPTKGRVLIGEHDIREYKPSELTNLFGIISQEPFLLHDTILNNIKLAKEDATQEEVEQAAKLACIHDKIISLENGYHTIVGERGYKLSGGEKQRIAIARIFLKNPPILILDEPTSSLDNASEHAVMKALDNVSKQRTVIMITHNLNLIREEDYIVVLNKGHIVEEGVHKHLDINNGLYKELLNAGSAL